MKRGTGHPDLDWLHGIHQKHKPKRWAVVRCWRLEVTATAMNGQGNEACQHGTH